MQQFLSLLQSSGFPNKWVLSATSAVVTLHLYSYAIPVFIGDQRFDSADFK